jgi:hypothetical protein
MIPRPVWTRPRARRPSKEANGEQEGQGVDARLPSTGVKKTKGTKKATYS